MKSVADINWKSVADINWKAKDKTTQTNFHNLTEMQTINVEAFQDENDTNKYSQYNWNANN